MRTFPRKSIGFERILFAGRRDIVRIKYQHLPLGIQCSSTHIDDDVITQYYPNPNHKNGTKYGPRNPN